MAAVFEEQVTAFVDFLGFAEASTSLDDITRDKLLALLFQLSLLRGEFDVKSTPTETGRANHIKPTVSTFSDHIVLSYPLQQICVQTESTEEIAWLLIIHSLENLIGRIVAAALQIGFLVRGGITMGKLYHAKGIVFGEAMVRAYQLESRTAQYPRILLSPEITKRTDWMKYHFNVARDSDGLYYLDYFNHLLFRVTTPGETFAEEVKIWFANVTQVISANLAALDGAGRLNELSKWVWFANKFRAGLEKLPTQIREPMDVNLEALSWPKE